MLQKFLFRKTQKIYLALFQRLISRYKNTKVGNTVFRIPLIQDIGQGNLIVHEPWMLDVLQKLQKENPGYFLDIGANIGQTLLKVKSLYSGIHYMGFEPNPVCANYLIQLVKLNNLSDCEIYPFALGSSSSIEALYFSNETIHDSQASILASGRRLNNKMNIVVVAPSQIPLLDTIEGTVLLKIDVEGYEAHVLKGLEDFIHRVNPIIIVEILSNTESINQLLENFLKRNYQLIQIAGRSNSINYTKIQPAEIPSNGSDNNYLLVPEKYALLFKYEVENILEENTMGL